VEWPLVPFQHTSHAGLLQAFLALTLCWPLDVSPAQARRPCPSAWPRPSQTESRLGLKCVKKLIKLNPLLAWGYPDDQKF
jgi:hypothetical protein